METAKKNSDRATKEFSDAFKVLVNYRRPDSRTCDSCKYHRCHATDIAEYEHVCTLLNRVGRGYADMPVDYHCVCDNWEIQDKKP